MALGPLLPIFAIGWSHLFSAGVVSPSANTATAEFPARAAILFSRFNLKNVTRIFFKSDG